MKDTKSTLPSVPSGLSVNSRDARWPRRVRSAPPKARGNATDGSRRQRVAEDDAASARDSLEQTEYGLAKRQAQLPPGKAKTGRTLHSCVLLDRRASSLASTPAHTCQPCPPSHPIRRPSSAPPRATSLRHVVWPRDDEVWFEAVPGLDLPSLAERATSTVLVMPEHGLVVKRAWTLDEAHALWYLGRYTDLPVPRLLGWHFDPRRGCYGMIIQHIPGPTLQERWSTLTPPEMNAFVSELSLLLRRCRHIAPTHLAVSWVGKYARQAMSQRSAC